MRKLNSVIGSALVDLDLVTEQPVVVEVQPGRIIAAVALFTEQLGWVEDKAAKQVTARSVSRFVLSPNGIRVELVEYPDKPYGEMLPGVHFGLRVFDPQLAAPAIVRWAEWGGLGGDWERFPEGKWHVVLPDIYRVGIQLSQATWDDWTPLMLAAAADNRPLEIDMPAVEHFRLQEGGLEELKASLPTEFDLAGRLELLKGDPLDEERCYLLVAHYGWCPAC